MKIKKTNPTPKSITHKKPTKISPSSKKSHNPRTTKYRPERYQRERILKVEIKKDKVTNARTCSKKRSLNKSCKLSLIFFLKRIREEGRFKYFVVREPRLV